MSSALPRLASMINAQSSVLSRHTYEHEFDPHVGDNAMMLNEVQSMRRTLDDFEKELKNDDIHRNTADLTSNIASTARH